MMTRYIVMALALSAVLMFSSCKKEEGSLSPSGITDSYVLPQGNNAFDNTIVSYYNKYNSYLLYKFNYQDIYWTPTGYTVPSASASGYWSPGHEVAVADAAYIPAQLDLIQKTWFNLYTDKFLKKFLPSKILLCSKVDSVYNVFTPTFTSVKGSKSVGAYYYYNSICVNYGNAAVATITTAQTTAFLKKVNGIFIDNMIGRKLTAATIEFTNSADYVTAMTTYAQAYGKGILSSYYGPTALDDWNQYVKAMVSLSETQLNLPVAAPGVNDYSTPTNLGILNVRKDVNGQIRKRYTMVRNYYINEYGVDLQSIGNAANP